MVIPSVFKRVIRCRCACSVVGISSGEITPSVIGVGYENVTGIAANANNITLKVFNKPIRCKYVLGIRSVIPVLEAYGTSACVILRGICVPKVKVRRTFSKCRGVKQPY